MSMLRYDTRNAQAFENDLVVTEGIRELLEFWSL